MCLSTFTSALELAVVAADVAPARDGAAASAATVDCAYALPTRNVDASNATTVFIVISVRNGGHGTACAAGRGVRYRDRCLDRTADAIPGVPRRVLRAIPGQARLAARRVPAVRELGLGVVEAAPFERTVRGKAVAVGRTVVVEGRTRVDVGAAFEVFAPLGVFTGRVDRLRDALADEAADYGADRGTDPGADGTGARPRAGAGGGPAEQGSDTRTDGMGARSVGDRISIGLGRASESGVVHR